jgi:hypothetical protein
MARAHLSFAWLAADRFGAVFFNSIRMAAGLAALREPGPESWGKR